LQVPSNLISLTTKMIIRIQPVTHQYLLYWKEKAQNIPDQELRKQALMSIDTKTFHCQGGALFGLLARNHYKEAIKFIVAYQTISDYLDNLCDRSTSLNPDDFRALHESMLHALTPDAGMTEYYRFRKEQDDGGYLNALVQTCREVLSDLPDYRIAAQAVRELVSLYIDLQVHKHVKTEERLPRLLTWFDINKNELPEMAWYEFAASTGSTLGIFCIIAYLFNQRASAQLVDSVKKAYFPWVQGLHILLDYFIDQEEDLAGSDLNLCSYYPNNNTLIRKLSFFYQQAQISVSFLPDPAFHQLIVRGLLSIYLADNKVAKQKSIRRISRKLLLLGGAQTFFLYLHCRIYRWLA
jgi:tetraprenyl-beta-curcumene synthase